MEYSKLSYSITKQINKKDKKEGGVYFTPPDTVSLNIELLSPYIDNIKTILEPSCGSGEYIDCVMEKFDNKQITGVEYNAFIFESIKEKYLLRYENGKSKKIPGYYEIEISKKIPAKCKKIRIDWVDFYR